MKLFGVEVLTWRFFDAHHLMFFSGIKYPPCENALLNAGDISPIFL
jgi:hypothetical protein